ncbi:hypothetical protein PG995_006809 [Apiospora arundinis]
METWEERLATWADPQDSAQHYIRFLEGTLSLDPNTSAITTQISEAKLVSDEVGECLPPKATKGGGGNGDSVQWHFKVLSFSHIQQDRLGLSIPRPLFRQIQDAWHLHPRTVNAFLSNNGVLTTTTAHHCSATGRSSTVWKVAVSRSTGFDCVSVTRDPAARTTYVLYHHLADEAAVFAALTKAAPERLLDHHFFVAVLYQAHHGCVEAFRHVIDMAVLAIEKQTRYGKPGRLMDSLSSQWSPDDEKDAVSAVEDPKRVIRQLSYCQTDLAVIGHVARCGLECGEQLFQAIQQDQRELSLLLSSGGSDGDGGQEEPSQQPWFLKRLRAAQLMTRDDVEYTRRRVAMVVSQVQQMKDRSQSQTSFMLNDLAQSEAQYTAAIAIDTKRDSIAMRTLSVLGIVFLPGTFVATLFSVDMFDWGGGKETEPSANTLRVSPSMWIYWVVAIPLTIVTFLFVAPLVEEGEPEERSAAEYSSREEAAPGTVFWRHGFYGCVEICWCCV